MRASHEQTALAEAARLNGTQPLANVTEALDLLLKVAGSLEGLRAGLEAKVADLTEVRYEHARAGEQARSEIPLLLATTRELTNLLGTIGKLDVAGKKARLEQEQWEWAVRMIEEFLKRQGWDVQDANVRAQLHAIDIELEPAE